ncbi:MAG: hypothetical protein ACYC0E_14270, partial [Acidimicrobiales bacterium]
VGGAVLLRAVTTLALRRPVLAVADPPAARTLTVAAGPPDDVGGGVRLASGGTLAADDGVAEAPTA